jgi:eukaryotic-like serine/threonine-protein kinase
LVLNEIKVHVDLKHPHIVTMYGVAFNDKFGYLLMELMSTSLAEVIMLKTDLHGKITWAMCATILTACCNALTCLHSREIQHRDLKSANVLVGKDLGTVKLCDFGLATQVRAEVADSDRTRMGTPGWMAPEAWKGQITKQSDIYALGVVAWELAAGSFPTMPLHEAAQEAVGEQNPSRVIPPGTPEPLKNMIEMCTLTEQSKRPQLHQCQEKFLVKLEAIGGAPSWTVKAPQPPPISMQQPPPISMQRPPPTGASRAPAMPQIAMQASRAPQRLPMPSIAMQQSMAARIPPGRR